MKKTHRGIEYSIEDKKGCYLELDCIIVHLAIESDAIELIDKILDDSFEFKKTTLRKKNDTAVHVHGRKTQV